MAPPRAKLSLPTLSPLPSSNRLPSKSPLALRILNKLSRQALIALAQEWLKASNQAACAPYLGRNREVDDQNYDGANSLEELQEIYRELGQRKGGKKEVVERIVEGDWRHGISLRQLAMADIQYLLDHPTSHRWTALRLVPVSTLSAGSNKDTQESKEMLPRLHAPTVMKNLQTEITPLVKAHYHLTRMSSLPITLLRVAMFDSPYNTQSSMTRLYSSKAPDGASTIFIAFPDDTPCVYVSLIPSAAIDKSSDSKSLRKFLIDALPKALSRPNERYELKPTALSARSLAALVTMRGPGRGNGAAGGWNIFADGTVEQCPLTATASVSARTVHIGNDEDKENTPNDEGHKHGLKRKASREKSNEQHEKMRKLIAQNRFGLVDRSGISTSIERFEVRIEDPFSGTATAEKVIGPSTGPAQGNSKRSRVDSEDATPGSDLSSSDTFIPIVRITFTGTDVFSGIRKLVENGAIDGVKMPGWMTDEYGVSVGVVKNGRIKGTGKGSGFV